MPGSECGRCGLPGHNPPECPKMEVGQVVEGGHGVSFRSRFGWEVPDTGKDARGYASGVAGFRE